MCGRFTLASDPDDLIEAFGDYDFGALEARYNIAPSQPVAALYRHQAAPQLTTFYWGLVPSWAKDRKNAARLINARAETVAQKPSFRSAFKKRRCLILADGYYEWVKRGGARVPHYIQRTDGKPFAFAGLWEAWSETSHSNYYSCTIITCAANDDLQALHHRMPVTIAAAHYDDWLNTTNSTDAYSALLRPAPPGNFRAQAVSTFVNAPAHEGPECVVPANP